jgi:hypothetical protein
MRTVERAAVGARARRWILPRLDIEIIYVIWMIWRTCRDYDAAPPARFGRGAGNRAEFAR